MKKTKFEKKIEKEDLHFKMAKVKAYLQMKLCLKKDRVYRHRIYEMFERDHFFDRHPNELPEPFYCMPTDIILYDLIKKSDLEKTKKGLIRLLKKCHTHKYLVAGRSNQDIVELFNQLDSTVNSGNSWYNVGIFDFANRKSLDEYIDHFQICFHNFGSSYATIEIQINLSKKFKEELASFIKNNYEKEGMCVHKHWINNKSKSGAKFGYAVSGGILSERAKCHIINERLDYVKNIFLKEISKFFPLMQFFKYGNLYGINVYETNITPFDKLQFSIYNALGIDDYYGFNFSDSERLYTSIDLIEENKKSMTNMMFIYNPNKVENYEMYNSAHNKVVHRLTMGYMNELYRIIVLKNLAANYLNETSKYRNLVNKCKQNKKAQKKLLGLKYKLSCDFYDFNKIDDELPVSKEFEKAKEVLGNYEFARKSIYLKLHTCDNYTSSPEWMWKQVNNNYKEIESDLNRKIQIASDLTAFARERSNRIIYLLQLVIAAATLFLVVFPEKAIDISEYLRNIIDIIF